MRSRSRSPHLHAKHSASAPPSGGRHIFLLAGQSNMAGRGPLTEGCQSALAKLDTRIAVLSTDGSWKTPADHPLHNDKPEKAGVGPGLSFARAIVDFLPASEQQVGLVPCAVGGSEIARWTAPNGDLYMQAVARIRQGQAAGGKLSGIIWHQGESDSGNDADATGYFDRLCFVVSSFRSEFNSPTLPVILGELGIGFLNFADQRFQFAKLVNDAILRAAELPNMAVASVTGLGHRGDRLHFSAAAADELGKRYAWKWLQLTNRQTVSLRTLVGDTLAPEALGTLLQRLDVGGVSCVEQFGPYGRSTCNLQQVSGQNCADAGVVVVD